MKALSRTILFLSTVLAVHAQDIQVEVVAPFGPSDGSSPRSDLVQAPNGIFYGTTYRGGSVNVGTVFKVTSSGTLTTLGSFNGGNGAFPNGLALGNDGNLYGTCAGGVAGNVFRLTVAGALTAWFPFNNTNGSQPEGALCLGRDGNFYGATAYGGAFNGGVGTVFRVTVNGIVTPLVSFSYAAGYSPYAGLRLGNDGNLYGTTVEGGLSPGGFGYGTVFQLTTNNLLTHLAAFNLGNGDHPLATVTRASDDSLYGTTSRGGDSNLGTVFHITTNGTLTTLVSFGSTNGATPKANLILGSDGNIYGTTSAGGDYGLGTIFRITPGGSLTTLISFDGSNGATPLSGLTIGSDGFLYGTTSQGGSSGRGVVFRLNTPQKFPISAQKVETGIRLQFTGAPAYPYILQSATSMVAPINWNSFATNQANSSGTCTFVDTNVNEIHKFYRALAQ